MNKSRRRELKKVIQSLLDVRDDLEIVRDEEDETRDNRPESLQVSIQYEESEACSEAMNSALDSIDEAIGYIEDAIS